MYIHIHFVEEKELMDRFGDSYREYRNENPAFFIPLKIGVYSLNILLKWGR